MPHWQFESRCTGPVAGVDEVGRGPLAGPVVAAAVLFARRPGRRLAALIDDSKKLSPAARALAHEALLGSGIAAIGVGAASVAEIARLNILHASLLAMARAVARLPAAPAMVLVDGNRPPALPCETQCVVGGDALSLSIAAASIVAKVTRDRGMARLGARFPAYGWQENAGYGTPAHRRAIAAHGVTVHHRERFVAWLSPV